MRDDKSGPYMLPCEALSGRHGCTNNWLEYLVNSVFKFDQCNVLSDWEYLILRCRLQLAWSMHGNHAG